MIIRMKMMRIYNISITAEIILLQDKGKTEEFLKYMKTHFIFLFIKKNITNSNLKVKDLIGVPWMLAFALRNDGWYLRQDIVWEKTSPMPESVKDRCTKSHEYIFLLSKQAKYYFNNKAIQEPCEYPNAKGAKFGGNKYGIDQEGFEIYSGEEYTANGYRNKRDVWRVTPAHYSEAHFATYPEE